MECNRDEAERAKEIAEKKFTAKDFMGARKFALKAHHLYPELDGLAQMMVALEVHIAAENKVNGDMDWYGILHVNQFSDESTVRKQYRKLVLLLHPDKNKSVGADGAFQLLSEAWSVLADRVKRVSYDQKRKGFQQRPSQLQKPASTSFTDGNASSANNGFYNFNVFNSFTRCTTRQTANAQTTSHPPTTASAPTHDPPPVPMPRPTPLAPRPPPQQRTASFFTACPYCNMQYEYNRLLENHNLLCPNCKQAFCAVETTENSMSESIPSGFQWSSNPETSQGQQQYPNQNPPQQRTATFWTDCPFCRMQCEYDLVYENQNMLCTNCKKAFCAVETTENSMSESIPSGFQWSSNPKTSQGQQQYPNQNPPKQRTATFWTDCPFCRMQCEYDLVYENQNMLCTNCKKYFCAVETTANSMSESTPLGFQWSSSPQTSQGQEKHPNQNPPQQWTVTFWTDCPFCAMQYEYHRVYENQNMLCTNCKKYFCAVETTANSMNESTPPEFQWSSNPQTSQGQQKYPNHF